MIFYFSGCGNSRWAAETLSNSLHESLYYIPNELRHLSQYTLEDDEALGFVFPVYAWAPPQYVIDFIKKIVFTSKPSYIYFVCTCGDETGYSKRFFERALEDKGWSLNSCASLVMPETYVNLPFFYLDTKEKELLKKHNAEQKLVSVISKIKNRQSFSEMNLGTLPFFKSYILKPFFYKFLISDKPFKATDACVSCGKCSSLCPLDNIVLVDGKPQWKGDCLNCMSCYHHCPTNAIQFGKQTKGKGQYFYERKSD